MKINGISKINYLAKGKRSIVYIGILKEKKVAIKTRNPSSLVRNKIENEAKFLKILNKHKIGPKLIMKGKNYIVYLFVEGTLLQEFLEEEKVQSKKRKVVINILAQARIMDKLKINKLEFTRPVKHIFVNNSKVIIIDFERAYHTKKPKNVTQFCQFLIRNNLMKRDIKILKKYKDSQTNKNFKEIIKRIK